MKRPLFTPYLSASSFAWAVGNPHWSASLFSHWRRCVARSPPMPAKVIRSTIHGYYARVQSGEVKQTVHL